MGFRFRKSLNLGGGFRINLSKSGVGYSWGVKGYRITKTATGRKRTTVSVPGTGISFVEERGTNKKSGIRDRECRERRRDNDRSVPTQIDNCFDEQKICNNVTSETVSPGLEEILAAANKTLKWDSISTIGLIASAIVGGAFPLVWLVSLGFLWMKIRVRTKGKVDLEYSIDPDQQGVVNNRLAPFLSIVSCNKVWRIVTTGKVMDKKHTAGAENLVRRIPCQATNTVPFPFSTNAQAAVFKSDKEILVFLPDKLFVFQNKKIGALNYSDISFSSYPTRFIESKSIPKDSRIVDYTWQYVNKSGGPDMRFNNNRRFPICLYGKTELRSDKGLNTVFLYSNPLIND